MKHFLRLTFLFIAISFVLLSCVKQRDFPVEPSVVFLEYIPYGKDSADCIISFRDGDGDIGIYEGDTASLDDFLLKYLYKDIATGTFLPYDANLATPEMDTLYYSYRVPNITPDGQYKSLEGEIKAKLRSAPIYHPSHKVVKFEITLRDRAGHVSNMVTTNEIVLP